MNRIQKARNYGINILTLWWSWRKAEFGQMMGTSQDATIPLDMLVVWSIQAMKTRLNRLLGKDREIKKDIL